MFSDVSGVNIGELSQREFKAGAFNVRNIYCSERVCARMLGWKFVYTNDESQKHMEGKFGFIFGRTVAKVIRYLEAA